MSVISSHAMNPQPVANKSSSVKNNDAKADASNRFMQQVFDSKQHGNTSENQTHFESHTLDSNALFALQKNVSNVATDKLAGFATTQQFLEQSIAEKAIAAQTIENMQNPVNITQHANPSTPDETVVYMLQWLASGHLSYVATDAHAAAERIALINGTHSHTANDSEPLTNAQLNAEINAVQLSGTNAISTLALQKNTSSSDSKSHSQSTNGIASMLIEQTSPYLKRRLIISHKDNQIHVILRDYFLEPENNFSELKTLLADIKQRFPGSIQLTINGHNYGDLNTYRQ